MTASEQIAAITPRVAELQAKCDKYYQHLIEQLAAAGYKKVDFNKLTKQQEHFWKAYFQRELMPLLSPQIVDARHPFPFLNNKDIYYIAQLFHKGEGVSFGIVPVSDRFERVMFIKDGDATCFAFIEELVAHYAATIFNASTVQKQCLFRVTRNADITVDEGMMDHDIDFRDVMSELLKKPPQARGRAPAVLARSPAGDRQVPARETRGAFLPLLYPDFAAGQRQPVQAGRAHRGRRQPCRNVLPPAAKPMQAPAGYDLYTEVRKHDVLLAYPYQSIRPFYSACCSAPGRTRTTSFPSR